MRTFEVVPESQGQGLEDVRQAAAYLKGQACTLAARSISDGMLRLQFNREAAYFAQSVLNNVEAGNISTEKGLKSINTERKVIYEQFIINSKRNIGLVGSYFQMTLALMLCGKASKVFCSTGSAWIVGHAVNNAKESTQNIVQNRADAEGPMRIAYQEAAIMAGYTKAHGNIAYGIADIGISAFGAFGKVPDPKAWRLWYYTNAEFVRGYRTSSRISLLADGLGTAGTSHSIYEEMKKIYE